MAGGMELLFLRAVNFQISEPEIWQKSLFLGKSKGGLTKGGLSPRFSEKIGGKSFLRNRAFSGQIGTFSGPIGAFSGPIGTNSSAPHHSHGGRAEIAPKGPFLAQLAPFGPSPPLLSPPLDFPDLSAEIPGFCWKFRPLKNIFRTLENGHSIRHQSIPPLSAGRFIVV